VTFFENTTLVHQKTDRQIAAIKLEYRGTFSPASIKYPSGCMFLAADNGLNPKVVEHQISHPYMAYVRSWVWLLAVALHIMILGKLFTCVLLSPVVSLVIVVMLYNWESNRSGSTLAMCHRLRSIKL